MSEGATFIGNVGLDIGPKSQRGRLGRGSSTLFLSGRTAGAKHRGGKGSICAGNSEESGLWERGGDWELWEIKLDRLGRAEFRKSM